VDVEETADLGEDVVKAACLDIGGGGDSVAVHRIANPNDFTAFAFDGTDQGRKPGGDRARAHPADQGQAAGFVAGVEDLHNAQEVVGFLGRADLHADRIVDAAQIFHMRAIGPTGTVAAPKEVGRAAVPITGRRIDPGQGLLVGQEQGFVGDVEVGLAHISGRGAGHPAGGHEGERLVDALGEITVAFRQRRALDEAQVPAMDLVQVGIAAGGERAEQVELAGGLEVGQFHAAGVGAAGFGGEVRAVDDIAAVGGQGDAVLGFGIGTTGLGELAGHAPHLRHRQTGAEGQDNRHLQQHAESVAQDVGGEIGETFGAIAAEQHEGLAFGGGRQGGFEAPGLAGEHQGRVPV
jgi:hypothetical protein